MYELNSRRIIHQARLNTLDFCISMAELEVIAGRADLTEGEKLLWLHLAAKTSFDSTLTCSLDAKDVVYLSDLLPKGVFYAIGKLQKHRFLKVHEEADLGTFYELLLPDAGLRTLIDAPKKKKCRCESEFYSVKSPYNKE